MRPGLDVARNYSGSSFDAFEDGGLGNGNAFEEGSTSSSSSSAVSTASDGIEILSVEAEASKGATNDLVSSNTALDGGPAANGFTPEVFEIVVDGSPDPVVQKVMTLEKEIMDRDNGIVTSSMVMKKDPQSIGDEKRGKRKREDYYPSENTGSLERPRVNSPSEGACEECETQTSKQHVGLVEGEWNAGSVTLPMPNGLEFNMKSQAFQPQNPGIRSNSPTVGGGTRGRNGSSRQDKQSVVAGLMKFGE